MESSRWPRKQSLFFPCRAAWGWTARGPQRGLGPRITAATVLARSRNTRPKSKEEDLKYLKHETKSDRSPGVRPKSTSTQEVGERRPLRLCSRVAFAEPNS
jgi:hypothetical protein